MSWCLSFPPLFTHPLGVVTSGSRKTWETGFSKAAVVMGGSSHKWPPEPAAEPPPFLLSWVGYLYSLDESSHGDGGMLWGLWKGAFCLAVSTFLLSSVTCFANSHLHVILLPLIGGESVDKPRREESDGCCLPSRAVANPHHAFVQIRSRCPFCGADATLGRKSGAGVGPQPFSWTISRGCPLAMGAEPLQRAFPDPSRTCEANEVPAGTWKLHDCLRGGPGASSQWLKRPLYMWEQTF